MKTLTAIIFRLFLRDSKRRIASAKMTVRMINGSTYGRPSHFYNTQGERIRGWSTRRYRFANEMTPLERKYAR